MRHIERTRVLVHMIDILPVDGSDPIESYRQIRKELEAYSPKLAAKPEFLAANKMDLAGASEALADLRSALPGKHIFAISAVAGTGLRPLLEELWQRVQKLPVANPLIEERPYVPPVTAPRRSDEEMFQYVGPGSEEEAWKSADGQDAAIEPKRSGLINAAGEEVIMPRAAAKGKKSKTKRTLIEPVQSKVRGKGGLRITAKERRKAHDERQKRKLAPAAAKAPVPGEPDADLAAEIAAMKGDDVRKGKFYNRRKDV